MQITRGELADVPRTEVSSFESCTPNFGYGCEKPPKAPRLIFRSAEELEEQGDTVYGHEVDRNFSRLARRDSNGFSGCQTTRHEEKNSEEHSERYGKKHDMKYLVQHDSWFCFKVKQVEKLQNPGSQKWDIAYKWQQPSIFVSWNSKEHVVLIVCVDIPKELREVIVAAHTRGNVGQEDPYEWHRLIIDGVAELYNDSVWKLKGLVREDVEKNRSAEDTNFERLHDIARHIIHANEILEVALSTLDGIQQAHELLVDELCSMQSKQMKYSYRQTQLQLLHLQRTIKATFTRSKSLSDRIHNEINLAYNLANQRDSFLMKTIAIMSLIYLPGSYLASIFGMNFFDFSVSNGLVLSDSFWLYWVLTTILTFITVGTWIMWQRRSKPPQPVSREDRSQKSIATTVSAWYEQSVLSVGWAKLQQRTTSKKKAASPV